MPLLLDKLNLFLGGDRFVGKKHALPHAASLEEIGDDTSKSTDDCSDSGDILLSGEKHCMLEVELYHGLGLDTFALTPDQLRRERRLIPFADLEPLAAYTSGWREGGTTTYGSIALHTSKAIPQLYASPTESTGDDADQERHQYRRLLAAPVRLIAVSLRRCPVVVLAEPFRLHSWYEASVIVNQWNGSLAFLVEERSWLTDNPKTMVTVRAKRLSLPKVMLF